ncbi:Metal transporter Nramp2 [Bienertia sinuspersici]
MDSHFPSKDQNERNLVIQHRLSESNRLLPSNVTSSSTPLPKIPVVSSKEEEKNSIDVTPKFAQQVYGVIDIDAHFDDTHIPPFSWKKLWLYTGPGILMSIAFLDPGNIEGDLQAGAIAGYSLLWLLLWSTIMGLLIQLLSARVGVATGKHLAELCREEYPPWARVLLWAMAEVAVIAADIQEVVGTAIAIQILSNGVFPLWASVSSFVFFFLESYGVRKMEAAFAIMVTTMVVSFAYMFVDAQPSGKDLLVGVLVPKLNSRTIQQAVGIFGCVITPHNIYLHSALVQSRKVDVNKKGQVQEAINYYSIESSIALLVSFMINLFVMTVFAKGFYGTKKASSVGLENAGHYLEEKYGGGLLPILYIWGIGLLAAGQSSTITGTYAGQFIMGGFLNIQLNEWLRAIITRSFAIVPTMILVLVFDRSDGAMDILNEWLNVLQSIQIPFSLIPLFTIVSKEKVMGIFKIGPTLEKAAWIVVAVVLIINCYVLVDFFMNVVDGLLQGVIFCILSAAYMAFIIYLIARDVSISTILPSRRFFQRFTNEQARVPQFQEL